MLPQRGNIGRPRQAGAAAHACTEVAARNAPCRAFRPLRHILPCPAAVSKSDIRHPHVPAARRIRKAKQGGRGGNYDIFPRPSATNARQLGTHCTDTGLVRRPLRLTAEVNSACLRTSVRAPHLARVPQSADKKLKETGGRGGNYFPRIAFSAFPAFPGSGAAPRLLLSFPHCVRMTPEKCDHGHIRYSTFLHLVHDEQKNSAYSSFNSSIASLLSSVMRRFFCMIHF